MCHLPVLPLLVAFALLAAGSVPRGADATCTFPLRGSAYTPCGNPLQGTHSKGRAPDNWQSDNAVDLCAPPGTKVYAVENGVICNRTCGFGFDPDWGYRLTLNAERDQFFYNHLGERKEREREVEGGSKRNPYVGASATKAPQPERKNNNVSSDERSKEIGGGKRSVDPPSEPYALAPRRLF